MDAIKYDYGEGDDSPSQMGTVHCNVWITRGYCKVGPQVVGQVGEPFKTRLSIRFMVEILYIYIRMYLCLYN